MIRHLRQDDGDDGDYKVKEGRFKSVSNDNDNDTS